MNEPFRIPLARPDLGGNEEQYLVDALHSSWISSTGPYVRRFEEMFAALCEARSAIAVCNGTTALHLALLTLDVRPGDEVIVPSLTFVATANAVRYVGAEPVFVDIDPDTWCIDPKRIEDAITPRTRGIIAVHIYGHPADMDAINHLAGVHGLWVVEDAAEAPLASYRGRKVGSLAPLATFSFYGNKVFTCGEGGALTLSDPALELRARTLRGQGMDPHRRYFFPVTGYNFRLTNLACALLCAQLERRAYLLQRRTEICDHYRNAFENIAGLGAQPRAAWADPCPWLFNLTVDAERFGCSRDHIMQHLARNGVETRPFFLPLHTLPPFREGSRRRGEELPVTTSIAACGFSLPTYPEMTEADLRLVVELVCSAAATPTLDAT